MTRKTANELGKFSPRGERRIVYVSDPSSIARRYLPDPTTEEDLRDWVDEVARARVDTFIQEAYTQGWTTLPTGAALPSTTMRGRSIGASCRCWTRVYSRWRCCWTRAARTAWNSWPGCA